MAFYALQNFAVNRVQAAMLRLFAGTLVLTCSLLLVRPRIVGQTWRALQLTHKPSLFAAILLGTFVALWLQQIAVASVTPGIAQTLLSTAPLFMLGLNVFRGQQVSFRAVLGTFVAMAGISLLFWR